MLFRGIGEDCSANTRAAQLLYDELARYDEKDGRNDITTIKTRQRV